MCSRLNTKRFTDDKECKKIILAFEFRVNAMHYAFGDFETLMSFEQNGLRSFSNRMGVFF